MIDKINGRTPEEIKRGLELCIGNSDLSEDYCEKCPYIPDASCRDTLEIDALALIQRLERERDAAVADMTELMQLAQFCRHCKHITSDGECTFDFAANKGEPWCWQWCGVQGDA